MRLVGFFILLVCCWTVSARDMLSLRGPSAQRFRDKRVNNLEIARLIRMIASLNQDAKPTVPLENDQIYQILAQIPQVGNDSICLQSESCAQSWIDYYNYALGKIYEKSAVLEYQFETNITEENGKLNDEFAPISNKFLALTKFTSAEFLKNSQAWDPVLRRMLYLASLGIVLKDDADAKLLSSITNELGSIYAAARVCEPNSTTDCLSLDPELTEVMKSSRDYDRLLWAWKGWHEVTGPKMKAPYTKAVAIQNRGAVYSNYQDLSERWIEDYEESDFEQIMDDLFAQIKPLYEQLHAYTRRKLTQIYGSKYPSSHNPKLIPAHLLGNMWAQSWENIFDIVQPYPDAPQVNLTKVLIDRGYTPVKIFEESELFFTSMGLYPMTPTFWKYSMLVKPTGREVQCHASAIDFGNDYDFRIKMCTSVNEENFYVVHHEMGHIEYFMAYSKQPTVFKNGANSAFHEAIGDTIALSVMTTKHFKTIGILDSDELTYEQEINFLMQMALKKLVFMPFGYLMDKWRWDVFRGKINESNYNQKWWEMINEFQGLEAPIERTENDFDPGAKYHIASFVPYSRYFISHFLQFHFYKALCDHAGHQGPYHKCDFYDSKTAGFYLKKTLEMGNSKHWSIALKALTGDSKMSAKPVLDYFKPLADWLQKENSKYPDDVPGF